MNPGIHPNHLRDFIVTPTLEHLHPEIPFSHVAVELLMLTAAQESKLGHWLRQVGGGPALGIFQMEPATWEDHDNWLLSTHNAILDRKLGLGHDATDMVYDLRYAAAMARVHYWRHYMALPADPADVEGLARCWKVMYNTEAGAGTVEQAVANYRKLVEGT